MELVLFGEKFGLFIDRCELFHIINSLFGILKASHSQIYFIFSISTSSKINGPLHERQLGCTLWLLHSATAYYITKITGNRKVYTWIYKGCIKKIIPNQILWISIGVVLS